MKKQIKYICECCGVDYDREEDAKRCEASHIKPVKIVKADYEYRFSEMPNTPVSVTNTQAARKSPTPFTKPKSRGDPRGIMLPEIGRAHV